jgi:hypothetical protein
MDEIVRQAMAKWPNVPDCYGWLALDARGRWRMRDERAQALNLPGDKVTQAALLGFINRNYMADATGRWYFQNGPQRVYVNLDATPYIARTDAAQGFVLHTGEPVDRIDAAWMTESGALLLDCGGRIALVEDRDMAQCMQALRIDGREVSGTDGEQSLLAWLEGGGARLTLRWQAQNIEVRRVAGDGLAAHFKFVAIPKPD